MRFLLALLVATVGAQQLTVTPAKPTYSGETVKVSWSELSAARPDDQVRVFAPANHASPVYEFNVSSICREPYSSCSFPLRLVNVLVPYKIDYIARPSDAVLMVTSVSFAHEEEPLHPRLAFVSPQQGLAQSLMRDAFADRGSVLVTWTSALNISSRHMLQYKPDFCTSCPWTTVDAFQSATYTRADMCGAPANTSGWSNPGYQYTALISDLDVYGRYVYQLGTRAHGVWMRKTWSFATPQTSLGTPGSSVHIFMFGDMGVGDKFPLDFQGATQTMTDMQARLRSSVPDREPMHVMHCGDLSYATGWQIVWGLFHAEVEPLASQFPWMVSIGNHEYNWPNQPFMPPTFDYGTDSGGECGVPYFTRFAMPSHMNLTHAAIASGGVPPVALTLRSEAELSATGSPKPPTTRPYYVYTTGTVAVVVMSSEHNFFAGSEQYKWMENTLAAINRKVHPWVIVTTHRPSYTAAENVSVAEGPIFRAQRVVLEPLLLKYQVDLSFTGHIHFYERTCALNQYRCVSADERAPIYVVVGTAGAPVTPLHPPPPFTLVQSTEHGFVHIVANSSTFDFKFIGKGNSVLDSFVLRNRN